MNLLRDPETVTVGKLALWSRYWCRIYVANTHIVAWANDEAYEPGSPKRSDYFEGEP